MSSARYNAKLEPVTLEEALAQCHAMPGIEDEWFLDRIRIAREYVEDSTQRKLYGIPRAYIPGPLRDAMLLYIAHSYDNRAGEADIPKAYFDLVRPYRLFD